jgi:hypothetical protein
MKRIPANLDAVWKYPHCGKTIQVGAKYIWWERTDLIRCHSCAKDRPNTHGVERVRPKPEKTPKQLLKAKSDIEGQDKLF